MRRPRLLLFETEASWFGFAGALDTFLTWILLHLSARGLSRGVFSESNPIARWVLHQWGMRGMVIFKILMVVLVIAIAEVVGRRHPLVARLLLWGGTLVVTLVVIRSFRLLAAAM